MNRSRLISVIVFISTYIFLCLSCIEVFNTCDPAALTDIDRFFDRFYRADKARSGSGGGTGIGLSIAKATAEAHGGSISAKTADGKSITFTAILP